MGKNSTLIGLWNGDQDKTVAYDKRTIFVCQLREKLPYSPKQGLCRDSTGFKVHDGRIGYKHK